MSTQPSPLRSRPRRLAAWPARSLSRLKAPSARWLVPVAALIGALAGGAYGMLHTPQYTATSHVLIVPTNKSDPATAMGFATAYGRVASQVAVIGDAQVWAGVPTESLKTDVQTATSPDAPMISVTATATRASTAVSMADGVARSLVLNGSHMQGSTNVRVVQFSRAVKPTSPTSPTAWLAALVGGCAGGLLGGLGLLVRPKRRISEVHASVPGPATSSASQQQQQPQPETV
ncbi:lipopolysaccharide biosynthesis protein [Streptomyces sp. NPDC088400]|uniref:lipopolysaccharide biosynthesis protein n=1 Tax=Streptomyces sp. NPDC088400 TaxID=3365861 RepID=UPI0038003773